MNVDLSDANLGKTALSQARLQGANLSGCDLHSTILDGAIFNQQTRWPEGFDPIATGAHAE